LSDLLIEAVSGLGLKESACFRVAIGGARFLLDAGAGVPPARARVGVDAILVGHQHPDHMNGVDGAGDTPVWATAHVAASIERRYGIRCRVLPLRGRVEIGGATVTTGRNGHSPGGVWLHLRAGDETLIHMGDHSTDCPIYPFDPPPPARVAIVDASDGFRDEDKAAQIDALIERLARAPALLPLPASGRGLEIPATLGRRDMPLPAIDDEIRAEGRAALASAETIAPDWAPFLADALDRAPPVVVPGLNGRSVLWSDTGLSAARSAPWVEAARAGRVEVIATGYVMPGTAVAALIGEGRAVRVGWNVHPTVSENRRLLDAIGARSFLPAFFDRSAFPRFSGAFARPIAPFVDWKDADA